MGNCIPTTPRARSLARVRAAELTAQYAMQRAAVMTSMQPPTQPIAPPPVAPKPSYDELVVAEANRRIERKLFQEDVAKRMIIIENDRQRVEREERFAKWEERALARRAKREAEKMIEKQKVNEARRLRSIQYELMRPAREAQNKANAERLALEKQEYVSKLEENFKNKFDYETLDKYARADECSKYTKFNPEFNKLLKDAYVIYHANPNHGFYQYLVMYHAVLRCNSSEGGARQWLYDSVLRD